MSNGVKVIIITGTMGAGKSTVMAEASDILTAADVTHAAIDFDALGVACLPLDAMANIAFRNLASVWSNYRDAGVTRLLLAEAVESKRVLQRIREAVPAEEVVVCRLKLSLATAQARVRDRDPGMFQDKFVAWAADLDKILDKANLEDYSITNEGVSVTEVATEMLRKAKWIK